MDTEKILKFILDHISKGTIDDVFNDETFDERLKCYRLSPYGIMVSKEFLDDVKSNPDHYKQFLFA